jgi:hypothetical protein
VGDVFVAPDSRGGVPRGNIVASSILSATVLSCFAAIAYELNAKRPEFF